MENVPQSQSQESMDLSPNEPRFEPREDDNENLWEVIAIVGERSHNYRVRWAGSDPKTGKPWAPSWVRKGDVTDDLVIKWKKEKKQRKEAKKLKTSGKRASTTTSTMTARRSGSTRTSVATANELTPVAAVATSNGRRDIMVQGERKSSSTSSSCSGIRRRTKRRRGSSDDFSDLPPSPGGYNSNMSAGRPRKKRKLGRITESSSEIDEQEEHRREGEEESTDGEETKVVSVRRRSPPPPSRHQQHKQHKHANGVGRVERAPLKSDKSTLQQLSPPQRTMAKNRKDPTTTTGRSATSGIRKTPLRRKERRGKEWTHGWTSRELSPSARERLREFDEEMEELERERQKQEELEAEAETRRRIREGERERERERQLEQARAQQTTQEEDEISALEYCEEDAVLVAQNPGHRSPQSPLPKQLSEEVPEPFPAPKPMSKSRPTIMTDTATTSSRKTNPARPRPSNDDPYRHGIVPETEFEDSRGNTKSQSQSLSLTQSQAVTLLGTGNDRTGSPPSMVVEPPVSLQFPPQTPSRSRSVATTIISKMRPRTPNSRTGSVGDLMEMELQLPDVPELERIKEEEDLAPDTDVSANDVGLEERERKMKQSKAIWREEEVVKDEKQKNGIGTSKLQRGIVTGGDEAEDTTSSIEPFSSPEKQRKSVSRSEINEGKGRVALATATTTMGTDATNPRAGRSSSSESDTIQRRGKHLAEVAKQAKLKSLPLASKKPLEEVVQQQKQASSKNGIVGVRMAPPGTTASATVSAMSQEVVPLSSIETASSSSLLVPNSDRALAEVPEEVVQQMEAAYVDLYGGRGAANRAVDEDTTVDDSNSLSTRKGNMAMGTVMSVIALRQEEEESTQDLLREARSAGEQAEDGHESGRIHDKQHTPEGQDDVAGREMTDVQQPTEVQQRSSPPTAPSANRLESLLQQERLRNQELRNEVASLQQALERAKPTASTADPQLEQQLIELQSVWGAERSSLTAAVEEAIKAKESAIKDADFFRDQYAHASGFVTSIRDENQELEKRAKIAEDQAKSGVAMIKATYEARVRELESHVEKWQMMASFLIQKDQRTDNDQLRRRAAEHPELEARCQLLGEEINMLYAEIATLEEDLKEKDKSIRDVEYWNQEMERLEVELHEARAEVGRLTQASEGSEMVYRCLWRTEANKPCDEIFATVEDLKDHFYSAGHLHH